MFCTLPIQEYYRVLYMYLTFSRLTWQHDISISLFTYFRKIRSNLQRWTRKILVVPKKVAAQYVQLQY